MSSTSNLDRGFSVVRLVLDEQRGTTIPVGVVAWDAERGWHGIRFLGDDEKLQQVPKASRSLLSAVEAQIRKWAKSEKVPYANTAYHSQSSAFWDAARRIMTTAVRLDQPRAMEPLASGEFELLYEAIVQPRVALKERRARIDGIVARALGPLAPKLRYGFRVTAWNRVEEQVLRGATGVEGTLLVEAVNLAAPTGRRDADALVSKILRVKEGTNGQTPVTALVGYLASPGGLNGEAHMRDWIARKATQYVFDLTLEASEFQDAVQRFLTNINPQGSLDLGEEP